MTRRHAQSCDDHTRFTKGCPPCQVRARAYEKRRLMRGYPSSAPAALTGQRLRDLRALGYTVTAVAAATGLSEPTVKRLCRDDSAWIQLRTFHAVEAAYRRLRDIPGPSARAKLWTAKHGWTPPEQLAGPEPTDEEMVDEVAVRRAIAGERVPLTRAERLEAWRQLEATGMTAGRIGARLHVDERTINRWRSGKIPASRRTA